MPTHATQSDRAARRLRNCYQYERNRLTQFLGKGSYRIPACFDIAPKGTPERNSRSVWHRLDLFCRRQQIDAVRYIRWCLDLALVGLHGSPPEPNQLLETRRMKAYEANQPRQWEIVRLTLRNNKDQAERHVSSLRFCGHAAKDSWAYVLTDSMNDLSPLFRYCLARTIGSQRFLKIAQRFEERALLQFHRNPDAYEQVWRALHIPADFRDKAERLYDRLIDQQP